MKDEEFNSEVSLSCLRYGPRTCLAEGESPLVEQKKTWKSLCLEVKASKLSVVLSGIYEIASLGDGLNPTNDMSF